MQRMLDRLAQAAEQQSQLQAMVGTLLRENEELRDELAKLQTMVTRLTDQRAETAQALRGLAAHVNAVNDQVLRQCREGTSSE
jgi:ABC-type transporter Mla subunit MlaD